MYDMKNENDSVNSLSIIVFGASGDLARNKIYPALFALFCEGFLPENWTVTGYARSRHTSDEFRNMITERLTCRYAPAESCPARIRDFLSHCFYFSGEYNSSESLLAFHGELKKIEKNFDANRLFYMAVPSSIFSQVAYAAEGSGLVRQGDGEPWSRVVVEKPFGRDRASSDVLMEDMGKVFSETQTYRIDHYLGKELVQNLMVLRFANIVFEPVWNNRYIDGVCVTWKESRGVKGRGGYFDNYGIIRDVMQNHLLQMLTLTAMEPPDALNPEFVRREKVRVLRAIKPVTLNELVIGQYSEGRDKDGNILRSYLDEDMVAPDSRTCTYAAALLSIENARWSGVPFLLRAGKGMNLGVAEIRVRFKKPLTNVFVCHGECPEADELLIRIQPDESISLRIVNKTPGLDMKLQNTNLNLLYSSAFREIIPDAYESLLLDVIQGDQSLFISGDELAAAWDVFTPALYEVDSGNMKPRLYPRGSGDAELLRDFVVAHKLGSFMFD